MSIIQTIKNDFKIIPFSVKWVLLIIAIWVFGWGFVDPMLSIYMKEIVNNYSLVGLLIGFSNLVAMYVAIPL